MISSVFAVMARTSPQGVIPDRAQIKPFHGLRIVFWAPENAPPTAGVITAVGTRIYLVDVVIINVYVVFAVIARTSP